MTRLTKEYNINHAALTVGQIKVVLMIHISLVILTIPKKFLLMAFFASGLFITNRAIPGKKKKTIQSGSVVSDTLLKIKHPEL